MPLSLDNQASLDSWLAVLETLHPQSIDMGLDRIRAVANNLNLTPAFPVVMVAGTNGKGSVCAFLHSILTSAGFKVGMYTSPHLLKYNERVRVGRDWASDEALVNAFVAIDQARGDTSLTYFEFGTLAAMSVFIEQQVDVAILEVGLGGRLDAVNVFEPNVSVVVSVDLDHQQYLGDTREQIGFEKAGVFRQGVPAICGDRNPPHTVLEQAQSKGAVFYQIGRDFDFENLQQQWQFSGPTGSYRYSLPFPALRGKYQLGNATIALAVLDLLKDSFPVSSGDVKRGLLEVEWPGRFQVLPGRPTVILDVAHNPHAATVLKESLGGMGFYENTYAVFAALGDKDIEGVLDILSDSFDGWFLGQLNGPRAIAVAGLAEKLKKVAANSPVACFDSVKAAYQAACEKATENDRIIVFGSFLTVADVMAARNS